MFTHVVVGANDLQAAKRFYDAALGALGHGPALEMGERVIYSSEAGNLMVTRPIDGNSACFGNGMTIGFAAPDPAAVDAFYRAGLAAGGSDEGGPGPRAATRRTCAIRPATS